MGEVVEQGAGAASSVRPRSTHPPAGPFRCGRAEDAAPAPCSTRLSIVQEGSRLVAVAFHGFGGGEAEVLADGVQVRMHFEGAAEQRGGLAELAEGDVAQPLA